MMKNADIYETTEALESSCPEDRLQSTVWWHLSKRGWDKRANEGCHRVMESSCLKMSVVNLLLPVCV